MCFQWFHDFSWFELTSISEYNYSINEFVSTRRFSGSLVEISKKAVKKGGRMKNVACSKSGVLFEKFDVVGFTLSGSAIYFSGLYGEVLNLTFLVMLSVAKITGVAAGPNPSNPTIFCSGLTLVPPKFVKL